MQAQLGSDGADGPVLGVMQAKDLGFERARDHRRLPRSAPLSQGGRDARTPAPDVGRNCSVVLATAGDAYTAEQAHVE
ncbi:MAG: hypothetical protein ACREXU_14290, partial [Gammaproteobacteria bacterium]